MKINIHGDLVRRSVENHILARRRNRQEEEKLEKKLSIYQRQHHSIDHNIHVAECRFEQHAKDDLGMMISYKHKPFECSANQIFYYPTSVKNWTSKEYSVEPFYHVLRHQNLYEHAFDRRSRQYSDELKQNNRLQKIRQEQLMNKIQFLIGDDGDHSKPIDWPLSEYTQLKLPPIGHVPSTSLPRVHFSSEI